MKFIVILFCIALNRYWMGPHPIRLEAWLERGLGDGRVANVLSSMSAEVKFLCVVGGPVLLVILLFWQIHGWLWGIAWVVGALIVLTYSIGISSLDFAVTEQSLWLRRQQASATFGELGQQHQGAMKKLVYEEFSKIYPVLFWFMLLGPGGALVYRLSMQYRNLDACSEEDRRISDVVIHALEWLPVRITGLAFAVVGVFANSTRRLVDSLMDWETSAEDLLFELAELAIAVREAEPEDTQQFLRKAELQMKTMQELLHRVLLFWIALLAIVTVVGWG